ncbi:hypothetical protein KSD_20800 [Ktedonobacter sp. SOSP1-85]|nr:hypothetical protein KSD_20800 [Ktedonobacter sp. SOSP1-85]
MGVRGEIVSDPSLGCEGGGSLGGVGRVVERGFRGWGIVGVGGEEDVSGLEFELAGMLGKEFGGEGFDEGMEGVVAVRDGGEEVGLDHFAEKLAHAGVVEAKGGGDLSG